MTREREDFFEHLRKPQRPKAGLTARSAVKALKESVANVGHKTGLPPRILDLFEARPVLDPGTDLKTKKPKQPYTGIASYVDKFAAPGDAEYEPPPPSNRPPSPRLCRNPELPLQARIDTETKQEKKIRMTQWKKEEAQRTVEDAVKEWDPNKDPQVLGDPYKILFVSRIAYDVDEPKIRREFEEYGPIASITIVKDKKGQSRGYAFIEYENKKDMKEAYKMADGKKIEGKRVVVDVERGRTVDNWRPRRFGGGLGGQGREPKLSKAQMKAQGITAAPPPSDRGGFGGGGDRFGGPPRGAADRGGGDRGGFGGPPRDFRGPPRDDYRGGSSRGGGSVGYDRDRDRGGDRDRKREYSPRRPDRSDDKRYRPEDDRSGRRRERDML